MSENCLCGSRLVVHASVKDALLAKMVAKAHAEWPLGDPRDPAVKVGAMVEKVHYDRVLSFIAAGKAEGARVVLGGNAARVDSGGYFIELTIFDNVTNECGFCFTK
jgi:gamma-glutamyl-gamma-aminobutyraldehyde dehydrogenase